MYKLAAANAAEALFYAILILPLERYINAALGRLRASWLFSQPASGEGDLRGRAGNVIGG